MARIRHFVGFAAVAAALATAVPASAQDHDESMHSHAGTAVDCATLASPPWTGLPHADRMQIEALRESVSGLTTPEAARAAGFMPALGDIPGMGVHYVHPTRTRDGVDVNTPDHLLFARVDGSEELVGAAYAFRDVPDTEEPIPFESDLAHWHDHPQFAPEGQTLHMLHVWFIPSSNGPFAGLNFWLPFRSSGIQPPSACWMADDEAADRIRMVSFALAPRSWDQAGATVVEAETDRAELLAALDEAAVAVDRDAWMAAADRFLADLSPAELEAAERTLAALTDAQLSSEERASRRPGG